MRNVSKVYYMTFLISLLFLSSCGINKSVVKESGEVQKIVVNTKAAGQDINIYIEKGLHHNHPSFAIWAEDMEENFIQTLFVTQSIATGIFGRGPLEAEKWDTKPGPQIRPAALPYWVHKRNPTGEGEQLPDPEHPVVDAYTGATPLGSVALSSKLDHRAKGKIRILIEVNQPWDWNDFWTNSLYDDVNYRTSCQPSLIYSVTIDFNKPGKEYFLNPIGHGHYSGENGELYTDLSTITTAGDIYSKIFIRMEE